MENSQYCTDKLSNFSTHENYFSNGVCCCAKQRSEEQEKENLPRILDLPGKGLRLYSRRLTNFLEESKNHDPRSFAISCSNLFTDPQLAIVNPIERPRGHIISFVDDPPYSRPGLIVKKDYLSKEYKQYSLDRTLTCKYCGGICCSRCGKNLDDKKFVRHKLPSWIQK